MQVDAEGAAVDLRHAQIDEVDQRRLQAALRDILMDPAEGAIALRPHPDIVEPLFHGRFSTRVRNSPVRPPRGAGQGRLAMQAWGQSGSRDLTNNPDEERG